MADIAEAANVARANVFNYFGSKHALIEAMGLAIEAQRPFFRGVFREIARLLQLVERGQARGDLSDSRGDVTQMTSLVFRGPTAVPLPFA